MIDTKYELKIMMSMLLKIGLAAGLVVALTPSFSVLWVLLVGYYPNYLHGTVLILCIICIVIFWHTDKRLAALFWLIFMMSLLLSPNIAWINGLFINIVITVLTIPTTIMVALALAVGKEQSYVYALKWSCYAYITVIRGVPLIGIMFFVLTLGGDLLPIDWDWPKILTLWLVYTLFASAYLAEVFRPVLHVVGKQYYETAMALGLSDFRCYTQIILPKVINDTIPAAFNIYIGLFKETSLVLLMGYFDVLNLAMQYLDEPAHYAESLMIYTIVLLLFWMIATVMHQWGRIQFRQPYGDLS